MNHLDGVIDVKDLFAELVRKAWIIILCTVLFAGTLGAYAFIQNNRVSDDEKNIESTLEKEELETANDYIMSVLEFHNIEAYLDDSIMMTCNPYNLYQTELKYVISGDVDETEVATLRTCYENYVLYGELISDVANADKDYAGKVLIDAITIDTESKVQTDTSKIISVLVYAVDEEQSEELVALVKEQIGAYANSLTTKFVNHDFELLSDNTIQTVAYELIEVIDAYEACIELIEAEMEALGGQLSTTQREYAVEILKESLDKKALKELKIEEAAERGNSFGVIKYAVLGGVVGFAMATVLIVFLYFFTNQIKSEKEVEHLYGIPHLGNCCIYKRYFFDNLAYKLFYKTKDFNLDHSKNKIMDTLVELCKEKQIKELGFVGRCDDNVSTIVAEIIEKIEAADVKCVHIEELNTTDEEFPHNIVCVASLKKTFMQDISKEFEVCSEKNITVRGYITFSK